MAKKKRIRYMVLDLGERISVDELLMDDRYALTLEVHRESVNKPYSRYHVQRVIPCKFEKGKLYKM